MVGLPVRKAVQEQALLAGFRPDDHALKLLAQWLQETGDEQGLSQVFGAIDTGAASSAKAPSAKLCIVVRRM